ncbi:pyrimidine 5'-nucleotidase [Shewanella zhangzhouensis]|uniref:pyrimidine 5'-nucleotidase n=1 Tax=Shewanella zhangzhouensis TaxID=2864213 RepID=UPI001C657E97|nr:pyrimidine 5'-nucleotidase [Shewanella zhangzhouensis]QYK05559.1 pyrimidine 5'-nucleotidase [Shewanella zhangzhouensis]
MSNCQPLGFDWVLFDADETLFHFDAFAGLKRLFQRFGVDFDAAHYQEYQQVNKPLWVEYQEGRISAKTLQEQRFSQWGERLGMAPAELNSGFLSAMADICAPLPEVPELLESLKGRYRLGIITNGFTELQRIRLERTGFADHFELLVISEEVGLAKPDRAIFDHALDAMGNPARERVLMVGDTLSSDILGGLNAGLRTCWYNPDAKVIEQGIQPHLEIRCHSELARLLA